MAAYLKKLFSHNPLVARKPLIWVEPQPRVAAMFQRLELRRIDAAASPPDCPCHRAGTCPRPCAADPSQPNDRDHLGGQHRLWAPCPVTAARAAFKVSALIGAPDGWRWVVFMICATQPLATPAQVTTAPRSALTRPSSGGQQSGRRAQGVSLETPVHRVASAWCSSRPTAPRWSPLACTHSSAGRRIGCTGRQSYKG